MSQIEQGSSPGKEEYSSKPPIVQWEDELNQIMLDYMVGYQKQGKYAEVNQIAMWYADRNTIEKKVKPEVEAWKAQRYLQEVLNETAPSTIEPSKGEPLLPAFGKREGKIHGLDFIKTHIMSDILESCKKNDNQEAYQTARWWFMSLNPGDYKEANERKAIELIHQKIAEMKLAKESPAAKKVIDEATEVIKLYTSPDDKELLL